MIRTMVMTCPLCGAMGWVTFYSGDDAYEFLSKTNFKKDSDILGNTTASYQKPTITFTGGLNQRVDVVVTTLEKLRPYAQLMNNVYDTFKELLKKNKIEEAFHCLPCNHVWVK